MNKKEAALIELVETDFDKPGIRITQENQDRANLSLMCKNLATAIKDRNSRSDSNEIYFTTLRMLVGLFNELNRLSKSEHVELKRCVIVYRTMVSVFELNSTNRIKNQLGVDKAQWTMIRSICCVKPVV